MAVEFTVEDGTGLPAATSYAELVDVQQRLENLGQATAFAALALEDQQVALNVATDYLDQRYANRWKGSRSSSNQALAWPRSGVLDADGYGVDSGSVPTALVHALAEAVKRHVAGTELLPDIDVGSGGVRREAVQVGPIREDITYGGGGKSTIPVFRAVSRLLELAGLVDDVDRVYRT